MTLASGLTATRQAGAHPLARYRGEFPIFRDKIYLNTCSLGALGERTRRRVAEFLDLWQERGASAWYAVWGAAPALRARDRRDPRGDRARPEHLRRARVRGGGTRLWQAPSGRRHLARLPHGRLPVAREAGAGDRARRRREPG